MNDGNIIVPELVANDYIVKTETLTIYKQMMENTKKLNLYNCSLCSPEIITRTHFHGSEFGQCFRQTQFNIINSSVKDNSDLVENMFLYDGHLHEELTRTLLGMDYIISSKDKEVKITRNVTLPNGEICPIIIVGHIDLILETSNYKFIVELKAVKQWTIKNKYEKGIIPATYYGQCQFYMEAENVDYSLLFFKNRTTSNIYFPFLIKRNPEYINTRFMYLGMIMYAMDNELIIPREYTKKSCDGCKFCKYQNLCWSK